VRLTFEARPCPSGTAEYSLRLSAFRLRISLFRSWLAETKK
jgi:hypothetical protein